MIQLIHISVETKRLRPARLTPIVAAVQKQLTEHLCPAWGIVDVPQLVQVPAYAPQAGVWHVRFMDHSDEAGDLGYHVDDTGTPEARIFVADVVRYKADLGVTFSHEVCEMVVDPTTQREVTAADGSILVVEVGDPTEADSDGYFIDNILVSDFCLPAYFDMNAVGPYDWCRRLNRPMALRPGGYQLYYKDGKWGQNQARLADLRPSWRSLRRGRGACHALRSDKPVVA